MKRNLFFAAILLLTLGLIVAFAQQGAMSRVNPVQEPPAQEVMAYRAAAAATGQGVAGGVATFDRRVAAGAGEQNIFYFSTEAVLDGKAVTGAPYSADVVNESTQMLVDGNRIVNSSTSKIYRDSQGRTRRETSAGNLASLQVVQLGGAGSGWNIVGGGGVGGVRGGMVGGAPGSARTEIVISDPVAGVTYVLDPEARTARKMQVMVTTLKTGGSPLAAVAQSPEMRAKVELRAAMEKAKAQAAASGAGTVTLNEGGKEIVLEMKSSGATAVVSNANTESLGTQTIEGVECEGTRSTITIPAGQIGNDLPIVITSERWYSPKLQTVVLTKRHDPRAGDSIYKLVGVNLSEPAASLFEVPVGYTILDKAATESRERIILQQQKLKENLQQKLKEMDRP